MNTCSVCKKEIVEGFCSEFCARVTDEEKEEFKNAKPNDFCVFPCAECGVPIEGEWLPSMEYGCLCTRCYPLVQLRACKELLKQVREVIGKFAGEEDIKNLRAKIDKTI